MYRVKVNSVDGNFVTANGKRLKIIENKPVKVGDNVWTDGRCVYGNIKEGFAPVVITSPVTEEILSIPILADMPYYQYPHTQKYFNFKENTLQEIEIKTSEYDFMINDYNGNITYYKQSGQITTLAENIDKNGNVYKINRTQETIEILKNEVVTFSLDMTNYKNSALGEAQSLFSNVPNFFPAEIPGSIAFNSTAWAFVENENKFAFIFTSEADVSSGENPFINGTSFSGNTYFCDESGEVKRIFHWSGYTAVIENSYPYKYRLSKSEDFDGVKGVKFPVQDDFYFTVDECVPIASGYSTAPQIVKIGLYSSNDERILQKYFGTLPYLTINNYSGQKYLLGVRDLSLAHYAYSGSDVSYNYFDYSVMGCKNVSKIFLK